MLAAVLVLAAVAVGTIPAAAALLSARWPYRSPAAAILLWQALGLSWGLAAVGALAGLGARQAGWGVAGGALTGAAGAALPGQSDLRYRGCRRGSWRLMTDSLPFRGQAPRVTVTR